MFMREDVTEVGTQREHLGCQHFLWSGGGCRVRGHVTARGEEPHEGHSFLGWSHWILGPKIARQRVYRAPLPACPIRQRFCVTANPQWEKSFQTSDGRDSQRAREKRSVQAKRRIEVFVLYSHSRRQRQLDTKRIISKRGGGWRDLEQRILLFVWIGVFSLVDFSRPSSWAHSKVGEAEWQPPPGWSTTTMCQCQRTPAARSTRQLTTRHPTTPPHTTHRRTTHPHTPPRQSTRPHSTARRTTRHRASRPPTRPRRRTSLRTARAHGTAQHSARRHRSVPHPWSRSHPQRGLCTSPMTSSSRI